MVASPMHNNQNYQKGGEATVKEKTKTLTKQPIEEILNFFQQEVNNLIKNLLENLMLEERRIYLEEQEDYANGFYTRDLLFVPSYFLKEGGLKSISRLIKVTEDEVKKLIYLFVEMR